MRSQLSYCSGMVFLRNNEPMSWITNPKDLIAGLLFITIGLGFVWFGADYTFGTAQRMGPGYFPTILGYVLAGLGVFIVIRRVRPDRREGPPVAMKPLAVITLAIILFGLTVRDAGLGPAVVLLVLISAYGSIHFRFWIALLLALGLSMGSTLLFVKGLGLSLPILGRWFVG